MIYKKGQIDLNNPIGAIIGLFVFFIFAILIISIFSTLNNVITQDQCKPYQEEAERLKIQFESDQIIINQSKEFLEQCQSDYVELANNTITRKDFEEVKGYFSLTQNEINTINKKIDSMDRIYNFYTIKNYSFALNFVLAIEILSLLFWKNEFVLTIFNWLKRKEKKKKENREKKDERREDEGEENE